jgi:MOSC domain-containing protein YiiM
MDDGKGSGTLEAIFRKRMRRGPMDSLESGELAPGDGLVGNADLRTKRQVTLIEAELWQRVRDELGVPDLDPRLRRANLLVRGVPLAQSRGRVLRVGPARLMIHGETRPCTLMEDGHPGLHAALDTEWRGGVYAEVLEGGPIAVGDPVGWE